MTESTVIDSGLDENTCRALVTTSNYIHQRAISMTPFIFPATVALFLFGVWVVLASYEPCLLKQTDPKFDCWGSLLFAATFASIGSVLTGLMALLARVVLYRFLAFETRKLEWASGSLASLLLIVLSYCVIHWELHIGNIGVQLLSWLAVSFVICCLSLMFIKRIRIRGES